jgi:hypothetical protein
MDEPATPAAPDDSAEDAEMTAGSVAAAVLTIAGGLLLIAIGADTLRGARRSRDVG